MLHWSPTMPKALRHVQKAPRKSRKACGGDKEDKNDKKDEDRDKNDKKDKDGKKGRGAKKEKNGKKDKDGKKGRGAKKEKNDKKDKDRDKTDKKCEYDKRGQPFNSDGVREEIETPRPGVEDEHYQPRHGIAYSIMCRRCSTPMVMTLSWSNFPIPCWWCPDSNCGVELRCRWVSRG